MELQLSNGCNCHDREQHLQGSRRAATCRRNRSWRTTTYHLVSQSVHQGQDGEPGLSNGVELDGTLVFEIHATSDSESDSDKIRQAVSVVTESVASEAKMSVEATSKSFDVTSK